MNPRVLAEVVREMEEWSDANRASQPDEVIEVVAFWARRLRREVPLGGMLAAAGERAANRVIAGHRQQDVEAEIAQSLATLAEMRRSSAATFLKIDQMLADSWAVRLADRRLVRWLRRRRGGRLLLFWLTMVAGIAALFGFVLALLPFGWLVESKTGSIWAGIVASSVAASFVISAWAYSPWSTTASCRLQAWLKYLEEKY
jgi:hypothetical protein